MAEHEFRIRNRLGSWTGTRLVTRAGAPHARLAETRVVGMTEVLPARGARALVPLAQGMWFAASGLWPLVHARSFEAVSGPKTDLWLARVAGTVIAMIGATLLFARARRRVSAETAFLGIASALVLAVADVLIATAALGRDAYLADAVLELVFVAGWALACGRGAGVYRVVTWNPNPEARRWK